MLLLERATETPDTIGIGARAMALLGDAYSRGVGVKYSHDKSLAYFARAALAGNPSAMYILAETLEVFPDALQDLPVDLQDPSTDLQDLPAAPRSRPQRHPHLHRRPPRPFRPLKSRRIRV